MPSYRICPECSERLAHDARQCACGWKDPAHFKSGKSIDPMHGKCTWTDGADRCRYPGSISSGFKGDGRFLCAFHFFNGDPIHAARIVQASFDWDGKPESYLALRKAHASRPRMDAHAGSEGVSGIPVKIRELVQGLRVHPTETEEAA